MAAGGGEHRCLDCGAELVGLYCHVCGQRDVRRRLQLGRLLGDALANILTWDSRALRTLLGMMRTPERVVRGYVEGQRQRYANPVGFFLVISSFLFLVRVWITVPDAETTSEEVEAFLSSSSQMSTLVSIAVLLPLVPLLRSFFREHQWNLAESAVLPLYGIATAGVVSLPIGWVLDRLLRGQVEQWSEALLVALLLAYAAARVYGVSLWRATARMVWAYLVSGFVVAMMIGPWISRQSLASDLPEAESFAGLASFEGVLGLFVLTLLLLAGLVRPDAVLPLSWAKRRWVLLAYGGGMLLAFGVAVLGLSAIRSAAP